MLRLRALPIQSFVKRYATRVLSTAANSGSSSESGSDKEKENPQGHGNPSPPSPSAAVPPGGAEVPPSGGSAIPSSGATYPLGGSPALSSGIPVPPSGTQQSVASQPAGSPIPTDSPTAAGVLWCGNVYPIRTTRFDIRYLLRHFSQDNHLLLEPALESAGEGFDVVDTIPRVREGGCFIRFQTMGEKKNPEVAVQLIAQKLKDNPVKAMVFFHPIRVKLVRGDPFLEDLMSRFPSTKIKVEMKGSEILQEEMFNLLRPFGRMADIVLSPPQKDNLRYYTVTFLRMDSAIGARNCLHGYTHRWMDNGKTFETKLLFTYEPVQRTSVLLDQVSKHPRIFGPLIAVLLALVTIAIFDPIRVFCIQNKITQRYSFTEYYSGFFKKFKAIFQTAGLEHEQWEPRKEDIEFMNTWLEQMPDSILILAGPQGVGKKGLVKRATREQFPGGPAVNAVLIELGGAMEASDDEYINQLSRALGFFPGFTFMSWVNSLMDILTPGASKAASTQSSVTQQTQKILECLTNALVKIKRKNPVSYTTNLTKESLAAEEEREQEQRAASIRRAIKEEQLPEEKRSWGSAIMAPVRATADAVQTGVRATADIIASPFSSNSTNTSTTTTTSPATSTTTIGTTSSPSTSTSTSPATSTTTFSTATTTTTTTSTATTTAASSTATTTATTTATATPTVAHSPSTNSNTAAGSSTSTSSSQDPQKDREEEGISRKQKHKHLPLFVITGLDNDNKLKHGNAVVTLMQWAADVTAQGLAHVMFVTTHSNLDDVSANLNARVKVDTLTVEDTDLPTTTKFVLNRLRRVLRDPTIDERLLPTMDVLGGRSADVSTFLRYVENGMAPRKAVETIVVFAVDAVRSFLFGARSTMFNFDPAAAKWTRVQAWQLLNLVVVAEDKEVDYDRVLFNVFKGDDNALRGLIRVNFVRLVHRPGQADKLKAGSPVLLEAFSRVAQMPKLKPGMDLLVTKFLTDMENAKLAGVLDEMVKLKNTSTGVPYGGWLPSKEKRQLQERASFLASLVGDHHKKLAIFEEDRKRSEKLVKAP